MLVNVKSSLVASSLRGAVANSSRQFSTTLVAQATLREIEGRLKSIKNIEKITKTMKTVASTKLNRAQRAMETGKKYGDSFQTLYRQAETEPSSEGKILYVVLSSDKGLCGGVHSQLSRATKRLISEKPDANIAVLGDKARNQLARAIPSNMYLAFNQVGRDIPTYRDAQLVADEIINSGQKFDRIVIVYNQFESAMSHTPKELNAFSEENLRNSVKINSYEIEDDVLTNLAQFTLANTIYWGLVEGHACEIAARRNAMDNASKNAGEMIDKFSILYNRQRQAVITNELIDIITGASAL